MIEISQHEGIQLFHGMVDTALAAIKEGRHDQTKIAEELKNAFTAAIRGFTTLDSMYSDIKKELEESKSALACYRAVLEFTSSGIPSPDLFLDAWNHGDWATCREWGDVPPECFPPGA